MYHNVISFATLRIKRSGLEASGRSGSIQDLGQTCETAADGRALCKCAAGTCGESGACGGFKNPLSQAWRWGSLCLDLQGRYGMKQTSIFCSCFDVSKCYHVLEQLPQPETLATAPETAPESAAQTASQGVSPAEQRSRGLGHAGIKSCNPCKCHMI